MSKEKLLSTDDLKELHEKITDILDENSNNDGSLTLGRVEMMEMKQAIAQEFSNLDKKVSGVPSVLKGELNHGVIFDDDQDEVF